MLGRLQTSAKKPRLNYTRFLSNQSRLYNAETWTLKEEHKWKLQVFEISVLRRILGVTRRDRRRNIDIRKELVIDRDVLMVLQHRGTDGVATETY